MLARVIEERHVWALAGLMLLFLGMACLASMAAVSAQESEPQSGKGPFTSTSAAAASAAAPNAACPGGPTIDGILLDECVKENFVVAGDNVSITVWYTKNTTPTTRIVGGAPVLLQHWINTDAQAQNVATWGREAWEAYHAIFGRHPWNCSLGINVRLEDIWGPSGIAFWTSSDCHISIDAIMVRNGDPESSQTVYHEFQHFMQRAYDDGCSAATRPGYPGNAEWVEGFADLGSDAVSTAVDAWMYQNAVFGYNPQTSFYDKDYDDVCNKYIAEQLGTQWTPAEPAHHMDAVREYYEECDAQDSLYVENTFVSDLSEGRWSWEELFLNFFAANWAKDWADPVTQPELVYTDDDANPYGAIALQQNVSLSTGSQSWTSEATPDDWAGRYYQVRPQAGCDYVTVEVDGDPGDRLGINLMAANTTAPSVSRSAWIGEDFTRTFGGAGIHDRVVASVNAFENNGSYDVSFTCVTPVLDLLEPRPAPTSTQVGDPASPILFLARFKVTSGGTPVRGLPVTSFSADAEGDAVTFLFNSLQEVGEEYWAIMFPPVKPAGTTSVDLRLCLDGTICDTHTDALRYADPGNTDFALVFDASYSMSTEDVTGEGMRYENAHKAGHVLADLLRNGDRVLVTDFSSLESGDTCVPDCLPDLRTHLPRTDVGAGTIAQVKTAIDQTDARYATPIGAALQDAKKQLLASPDSLNPKVIVLLSDGGENVNPMYADVRTELINSGVIIDTVGFGIEGQTGERNLARIAADTGGTFRFVPSVGGTLATINQAQIDQLRLWGMPDDAIQSLIHAWLPGPLGLDEAYDYLETKNQGAARLFHLNFLATAASPEVEQYVDQSVNRLRFVVAGKAATEGYVCDKVFRWVQILQPGADPLEGWVWVSPIPTYVPASWDVRNGVYDDVAIIPNPAPGMWKIRAGYETRDCLEGGAQAGTTAPADGYDFMMTASAQSDFRLEGRFLAPIVDYQGDMGDTVPIVGTLLSRSGAVPGAGLFMFSDVLLATVEKPGSVELFLLYDDGLHSDGAAKDGIYGGYYGATDVGGTYDVRIQAWFDDPNAPGNILTREWRGAFWIEGLEGNDGDADNMPDGWEEANGLDTSRDDSQEDSDNDGLKNIEELHLGTKPSDPDTDDGGEQDGSEVAGLRLPLHPPDDEVGRLGHITAEGQNGSIHIQWPRPGECQNLRVYVSTSPLELGAPVDMGNSGDYSLPGLTNGTTYYLTFVCLDDCGDPDPPFDNCNSGAPRGPIEVTPKEDPDPPYGAILINNGAPEAKSRYVMLNISATDEPLLGIPSPAAGAHTAPLSDMNAVTGVTEMLLSEDPTFAGAEWEPYVTEKPWTLDYRGPGNYFVFAKFRDEAGNESMIARDYIYLELRMVYLPVVLKDK